MACPSGLAANESSNKRKDGKRRMDAPNVSAWQIGQPAANKAGGRTASIIGGDGGPIQLTTNVLRCPFDASGYNDPDAARVTLCLEADDPLVAWCNDLDAEILKLCQRQSQVIFGRQVSESGLKANYYSPLKENDKYGNSLFKAKMNKVGRGAVRVWNRGGLSREMPENWQDLHVQAKVVLKSLWIQGRNWGLTFEVTDALVATENAPVECPFARG